MPTLPVAHWRVSKRYLIAVPHRLTHEHAVPSGSRVAPSVPRAIWWVICVITLRMRCQVRPAVRQNQLHGRELVIDGRQWLAQRLCQGRKHVGKVLACVIVLLRNIAMHFRDKRRALLSASMHVPVVGRHDGSAIGMTVNQSTTPGVLNPLRGLDILQPLWKHGPQEVMRCAAMGVLIGKPIAQLHAWRPSRDMARHRSDQRVRRGGRTLAARHRKGCRQTERLREHQPTYRPLPPSDWHPLPTIIGIGSAPPDSESTQYGRSRCLDVAAADQLC